MADQDFEIKIVTTADTSGIKEASGELDKLVRYQGRLMSESSARSASLRAALPGVPKELQSAEPLKEAEKATENLAKNGLLVGLNLGRARQEATYLVRELATGVPTTRTLSSLLGALGIPIAAATLAGVALNKAITRNAEEQLRVNQELDAQGEKLVELTHKWTALAQSAITPEDVGRVAKSAMPALDDVTARLRKAQLETTTWYQGLLDALVKGPTLGGTVFEDALNKRRELLQREKDDLDKQAAAALKLAQEYEHSTKSVAELREEITELKAKQDALNASSATYVKDWDAANDRILNAQKRIDELKKKQQEANRESQGLSKDLSTPKDEFQKQQAREAAQHESDRAALEQKRREAVGSGDLYKAKEIEDQLRSDTFYRDQEKERLQRYSALQESIPGVVGPGGDIRPGALGSEGRKKYEAAQDRLAQIYEEEGLERGTLKRGRVPPQEFEKAAGGSSYQDFANALKNMEAASKQTKEEMANLRREMIGIWR